jgi:poly(hydroxyalkanoate) depolymerase family esterase
MEMKSPHGMQEATRLTREGRLIEATALLQRMLFMRRPRHHPDPAKWQYRIFDGAAEVIEPSNAGQSRHTNLICSHDLRRFATAGQSALKTVRSFLTKNLGKGFKPGMEGRPYPFPVGPKIVFVPEGAEFLAASFSNGVGTRPYKLYVPTGYCGRPVPLIVMLHGCTQSADDFAIGTRMNLVAEEHTCLVVYPEQTIAANPSKCWNWFRPEDQKREGGEPELIAGITGRVMEQYSVDPDRVFIGGFSAGAAAAAVMGTIYSDLYAAIGIHSGLPCGAASDLPSALLAMRRSAVASLSRTTRARGSAKAIVPTIVFHGDQDIVVDPRNGDEIVAGSTPADPLHTSLQDGQVAGGHTYGRTVHTDSEGATVLEQWVIHGAGHAWAGGSPEGSYTDPHGPDATREMVRFFLEHPRSH